MSPPILETKLFIPPHRPNLVPRQRLIDRLNAGLHRKLTLVSAPAGFGKTTLVSEWLASNEQPVAWLSLDAGDNDLTHFLNYLVAAIRKISPSFGEELLANLMTPASPSPASLAVLLINGLAKLSEPALLVLDDYHVIKAPAIRELFDMLVEHLPPTLHLIVTTRVEPDLPLPRLRVRGQLTEIRAADLRFTAAETAAFLNQSMRLNLSEEAINTLESRTEGWIAGLQLAALSLQNKTERDSFIQTFSGGHRYVIDYLVEEVLQAQPEHIRNFLLITSILDRLNGPLCDAVSGRNDSLEILATLEQGNLFLIPLDEERNWYRYHHLFADVLRALPATGKPDHDSVQLRHAKASKWFEQNGLMADAIQHAHKSHDYERLAVLVENAWPSLRQIYNDDTLIEWIQNVPESLLKERPLLNVSYAFALLSADPNSSESRLKDVEAWLDSDQRTPEELEDAQNRSLPGMAAVARAYQAGALQDLPNTIKHTRRALELLPEDDFFGRGSAEAMLGLTYWSQGDITTAYEVLEHSLGNMRLSQNASAVVSVMFLMADISLAQAKLQRAETICRDALSLAAAAAGQGQQGTANIHVILAEVHYQRGELELAKTALADSKALGEHATLEVMRHRWYIAMAHINMAEGDFENAMSNLDEAEAVHIGSPSPEIRPIDAIRARFWIRQGKLHEAEAWAETQGLPPEFEINHLLIFPTATYAMLLFALKKNDEARSVLDRLATITDKSKRTADLIDILIQQSQLTGEAEPLQRALTLAYPEQAIQRFLNPGKSILPIFQQIKSSNPQLGDFISRVISRIKVKRTVHPLSSTLYPLIEPLSDREIEVLTLMAEGLTNQQIADQLFLTLNTIKVHSRNIYGKLDVHNRTQAVKRAQNAGILNHL